MKILFVGDVVGSGGRRVVNQRLPDLVHRQEIDLVIVKCENSAAWFGVTPDIAEDLLELGVDVLTSGNHIWDKKAILDYIPDQPRLIRPHNYPDAPGSGIYVGCTKQAVRYAVLNLQGRTYLPSIHCPFRTADALLSELDLEVKVRFLDFHAEVTSEKSAMGWYLDGRISGLVGTHTHVQTADERVLTKGTAYLTDAGMTGAIDSVIGMDCEGSIRRFLTGMPSRFEPAGGVARLSTVIIDVDEQTGLARSIRRHNELSS